MAYIIQQLVSVLRHSYSKQKGKVYRLSLLSWVGERHGSSPVAGDWGWRSAATLSARCGRQFASIERTDDDARWWTWAGQEGKGRCGVRPLPSCPAKEYSKNLAHNSYTHPTRRKIDDDTCDGNNTTHSIRKGRKGKLTISREQNGRWNSEERRGWTSGTEVTLLVLNRDLADCGAGWSSAATPRAVVALLVNWKPWRTPFFLLPTYVKHLKTSPKNKKKLRPP